MSNTPDNAIDAIGGISPTTWSGSAFRHTSPNREPLSGLGAYRFGGRWNPPDLVATIYLAAPREACVAEFMRMAEGQGRGPQSFLPRDLHEIEVNRLAVLDLTQPGTLSASGITMAEICGDDWSPCQLVGEAAHFLGFQGVMAPSATGLGIVIAAFERTLQHGQLKLVDTRTLVFEA